MFEDRKKGIVNRENFDSTRNDFCKEFRSCSNAIDFIDKFQSLTTFDRVQQIALQKLDKAPNDNSQLSPPINAPPDSGTSPEDPHQGRDQEDPTPPAKRVKKSDVETMGDAVATKKVGE